MIWIKSCVVISAQKCKCVTKTKTGLWNVSFFSNESTFHISREVNEENVYICGSGNPTTVLDNQVQDSPKVNVFCDVSCKKVYVQFFFEGTITGASYLDMLQNWLMPQLQKDSDSCIFQLDEALFHCHDQVVSYLDAHLPCR